eukprot:gene9920-biopygen6818
MQGTQAPLPGELIVWSWNCNALTVERLEFALEHRAHVYCFQETGRLSEDVQRAFRQRCERSQLHFQYAPRTTGAQRGGTALAYSTRYFEPCADTWDLPRLQRVEITWAWLRYRASPSTRFVVASVYAPPAIPAPTLTADMEKLLASPRTQHCPGRGLQRHA